MPALSDDIKPPPASMAGREASWPAVERETARMLVMCASRPAGSLANTPAPALYAQEACQRMWSPVGPV
jgi:hypothetical protein